MKTQFGARLTFYVLAGVLLTLFLCHSWYGPDIWYHLTWGRGVVEHFQIFPEQRTLLTQPVDANVYWIFQSLMYLSYISGGIVLVSLIFIALWMGISGLWLKLIRAPENPVAAPWLLLAFILCNQIRFEHRPEIFSYLFIVLFLWWFEKRDRTRASVAEVALLFALQVLWTNTHGYFALGPLIAGAYFTSILFSRSAEKIKRGATYLGVTAVASLVSPAGFGSWKSVIANASVATGLQDLNSELFPPSPWPLSWPYTLFWIFWAVVAVLILRAFIRRRDLFAAFVGLGGVLLSAQAVRNLPMVFLLGAPILATLPLPQILRTRAVEFAAHTIAALVAIALGVSILNGSYHAQMGSLGTFGIHLERASYPIDAVERLQHDGFKGKIFTDSYDGGYVEYHLPEAKISGDSYFSDPDLTRTFFAAIRELPALQRLHDRFSFDALLINVENLEVLDALLKNPAWSLVYSDSHRALFYNRALSPAAISPAQSTYYNGEDLTNWMYAFGPMSWAAVGRKNRDRTLLLKLARDVSAAPAVPAGLIKMLGGFAAEHSDKELLDVTESLKAKQCCQ